MRRIIQGHFYEKPYFVGSPSFKEGSKEITFPPKGNEESFVVWEDGELFCYFVLEDSYEASSNGPYRHYSQNYIWIRSTINSNSEWVDQVVNFSHHVTYFRYNNLSGKLAGNRTKNHQLITQARASLPQTLSVAIMPLEVKEPDSSKKLDTYKQQLLKAILLGIDYHLLQLDTLNQETVLRAAITGYGIYFLNPSLQTIAVNIRYFLLPESIKFLQERTYLEAIDIYTHITWRLTQGNEVLYRLAQNCWQNNHYDVAGCSIEFLRKMFNDFCAYRHDSMFVKFDHVFKTEITALPLGKLQKCFELITLYADQCAKPKESTGDLQEKNKDSQNAREYYRIQSDLLAIAQIHETTPESQREKISKFYHQAKIILNERILYFKEFVNTDKFSEKYLALKKNHVDRQPLLRSITLDQAIQLFTHPCYDQLDDVDLCAILQNENVAPETFFSKIENKMLGAMVWGKKPNFSMIPKKAHEILQLRLFDAWNKENDKRSDKLKEIMPLFEEQDRATKALAAWQTSTPQQKDYWLLDVVLLYVPVKRLITEIPMTDLPVGRISLLNKANNPVDLSVKRTLKYHEKKSKYHDKYTVFQTPEDVLKEIIRILPEIMKPQEAISDLNQASLFLEKTLTIIDEANTTTATRNLTYLSSTGETAMLIYFAMEMIKNPPVASVEPKENKTLELK